MGDGQQGQNDERTEVLAGEVVPAGPHRWKSGEQPNNSNGKTGGKNNRGQNPYADEDKVKQVIADRISGMSLKAVGERYGVSDQTVANWTGEDRRNRTRVEAAEARAEASQQLDVARDKAWELYRLGILTHNTKLMRDALGLVESVTNNKARLEGAIMPVRVDMHVTAVTEAEQELQEMLNEARAKTAAEEADVIRAASEDPDL
jgi:hypothetical protein